MTILAAEHLSIAFGGVHAVDDVSLAVAPGLVFSIIGPNGAGKTTLFNLIGGYQPVDGGSVTFRGRAIDEMLPNEIAALGVGRTFQNLQLFDNMTVLDNVMSGRHRFHSSGIVPVSVHAPRVRRDEEEARRTALEALRFVGLRDAENLLPTELSFGHQRLVEPQAARIHQDCRRVNLPEMIKLYQSHDRLGTRAHPVPQPAGRSVARPKATPRPAISCIARSSEPSRSIARHASSSTVTSNPSAAASSAACRC